MITSIVVGTDGSETASEAVRHAGELARSIGCRVHIVSAYQPVSGAHLSGQGSGAVSPDFEVEALLQKAAGIMHTRGVDCECYARKSGDPADAVLRVAEEQGADLIIVGSKGMQGGKRFLLGSVPDKISHHAPCSVMIIRTA